MGKYKVIDTHGMTTKELPQILEDAHELGYELWAVVENLIILEKAGWNHE